jgi:hypothetical protein
MVTFKADPGSACMWSTGTTLGVLKFEKFESGITIPDPGSICIKIPDRVEVPAST